MAVLYIFLLSQPSVNECKGETGAMYLKGHNYAKPEGKATCWDYAHAGMKKQYFLQYYLNRKFVDIHEIGFIEMIAFVNNEYELFKIFILLWNAHPIMILKNVSMLEPMC
jgi:hypothetical protein